MSVTHGPPVGYLDWSMDTHSHGGDVELRRAIERLRPKLNVFEHFHNDHGQVRNKHTLFVNASVLQRTIRSNKSSGCGRVAHQPERVRMNYNERY